MHLELIFLFFLIAAVYASAGFGGGSSYLAVMALWGVEMSAMRSTSLLCNIVVVAGGTWIFWKNGHISLKRIAALCVASVPMAFLGGAIPLKENTFFLLLGSSLVLAALLMLFQKKLSGSDLSSERQATTPKGNDWTVSGALGGGIGLLSGMVGIGGGIFLSPCLHLLRWSTPKNIAAAASVFILVNSIAGLLGQMWQHKFTLDWAFALPLMLAVLAGGQIGSRLSALKFQQYQVRQATALLVLYAGINILWTHI
jgi:uncharacterized membrane protein YfcA